MTDGAQKFVKVFGERNTGTRALIRMLNAQPEIRLRPLGENTPLRCPAFETLSSEIEASYQGKWQKIYRDALLDNTHVSACPTRLWKHTAPEWSAAFVKKQAHVIFCVRDPYSWALALARRPYHQRGPRTKGLMDVISQPWITLARDNMAPLLRNPLELWNGKNAAYRKFMGMAEVPVTIVRFEGFVECPAKYVKQSLAGMGLRHDKIYSIAVSTKNRTPLGELASYYRKKEWKTELSREVVGFINSEIDWELAEHYGYKKLDPNDFPIANRFTSKSWFRSHNLKMRSGYQ